MKQTNWSGTFAYGARAFHSPRSVEELQEIVARAPRIRALGTRHSFNDIADSEELVSVSELPAEILVDDAGSSVSVGAGCRYGELAEALDGRGLALHNLASLPHISVAGAVATATHGSGVSNGNLASAVTAIELVRSDGELVEVERGEPDFAGTVVNLGALGVVTRLSLEVEPAYLVRQYVFERLPWGELERLEEIMSMGYSVSVFTLLGDIAEQVWVKRRDDVRPELPAASEARADVHPIAGMSAEFATRQMGVAGPWYDRLPHFRLAFVPSNGDELQSEYHVARRDGAAALQAVKQLAAEIAPLLQICELRSVAKDELWMSPQYQQDTLGIHFTWAPDQPAVERVLTRIERALEPFSPRPHWGKLSLIGRDTTASRYERLPDFQALMSRFDPRGAFRNAWVERVLG